MLNNQITQADQWMLDAALCAGEKAEQAWRAWRATLDFDQVGPRYLPLIPLLQQNLVRLGIQDPLIGKFKGIQRQVLYKNQLLLHQARDLIQVWQAAGIAAICLTDIALAAHYHADLSLRPIRAFQFLLRPPQVTAASHWLQQKGWRPEDRIQRPHFKRFINAAGFKIDLHLHLFPPRLYAGNADLFWAASMAIRIQDVTTYALNPTVQLLALCTQPPQKHFAHLLWIADALTLLRHSQVEIDWARLYRADLSAQLRLRLSIALHDLAERYDAPIPAVVLHFLATAHPLVRKLPRPILRLLFTYLT